MNTEIRTTASAVECRDANDGSPIILEGCAIVFDSPTEIFDMGGPFIERISPNAFDNIMRSGQFQPVLLMGHDLKSVPLASVKSGTMQVTKKADGIHFRADLDPKSPHAKSVASAVRRGDLSGCSFSFGIADGGDRWTRSGGVDSRLVTSISHCSELTLTAFPAYDQTSVSVAQRAALARTGSSAQLQRANTTVDEIRAGKVVSKANLDHLSQTLHHLQEATSHVKAVHGANLQDHESWMTSKSPGTWPWPKDGKGNAVSPVTGDGSQGGSASGYPSGGSDGTGSRAAWELELEVSARREWAAALALAKR